MKNIYKFALIPILFLTLGLKYTGAQNPGYIPMLNPGAVWFETYTNYSWPPSPYGYSYCGRKYLDGDTIINDKMYHKIYHEKLDIYCTNNILAGPEYVGAIREDIPEQKVWYFPPEYPDETLYFDFSLSAGDTVSWWLSWFNQYPNMYLTVSGIDTITTIDGVERRRWLFDEEPLSDESSMIEGIGCSSGLLASYEVVFEYWNYLINLSIDTTMIYCRKSLCEIPTDTCTTVGLKPYSDNSDIRHYPNPVIAGNPLRITGIPNPKNELVFIELYDILGNKVESYRSISRDLIITAPKISGLYVINIYNSTVKSQIKILVKP
jgi:hypothetical protein